VSFTKGCYVGQEVVARAEHQGHLNKRLCGLLVTGETLPARAATIYMGDRKVGVVTSAVRSLAMGRVIALGTLRRECWDFGTKVQVGVDNQRLDAEVTALPFVST
jgi:folate-binding Fe-S cluster repair protein YgfZ